MYLDATGTSMVNSPLGSVGYPISSLVLLERDDLLLTAYFVCDDDVDK